MSNGILISHPLPFTYTSRLHHDYDDACLYKEDMWILFFIWRLYYPPRRNMRGIVLIVLTLFLVFSISDGAAADEVYKKISHCSVRTCILL